MRAGHGDQRGRIDLATDRTHGRTGARTDSRRSDGRGAAAPRGSTARPRRRRSGRAWPRTAAACTGAAGRGRACRPDRISATRPAYITTARSQTCVTSGRSCVTRISARPRSTVSDSSSWRICACTITSNAVVGSSASSTFGLQASAIAMAARCRMPPENSCGYRAAPDGGDPDQLEQIAGLLLRRGAARRAVELHRFDDLRIRPS